MSDLISRQAAIDALDVLCQEHRYKIPGKRETYSEYNEAWQDALDRAEGAIFNLPSAQPEPSWECEKCMMEHTDEMEKLEAELAIAKSKQPEPCEDAVSRLEIVRNLHKYFKEGFEQDKWWNSGHVIHAIMDAPSVTPNVPDKNVGELISREQAIDALRTCYDTETITMDNGDEYIHYGDAVGEIEQLPPIQPDIVRCKDCKHFESEYGYCDYYQWNMTGCDFCSKAEKREVTA